ncbi:MAG: putative membrane protein YedE/YeeE [Verrucomicrobiales bacterium]|jgi:uncharacterized membrane protein YedE/YeeE
MTILLAVVAGGALGYTFSRGDFCFHSTWRNVFSANGDTSLVKAYGLLLLISTPLIQILIAADVIDPFIPRLSWGAALVGGATFGIGMVIASTCVSGMFYKLGNGMLGMVLAIGAWALGDIVAYRGPLRSLRDSLNEDPLTYVDDAGEAQPETVLSLAGGSGWPIVIVVGLGLSTWLWRAHLSTDGRTRRGQLWGWAPLGLATAVIMVLAWLLTRWHGADYTYGTSGVPTSISRVVFDGEDIAWWIPLGLLSLVPGALLAARLTGAAWLRGEATARYAQLTVGGFVMGVGAGIAGGCNLGHSMVGVPLLSLGSIVTTIAIIGGVFAADRVVRFAR